MNLKILFYIYFFLLLLLSVLPLGTPTLHLDNFNIHFRLDYLIHFLIYCPWLFLSINGLRLKLIYAILLGILLGATTEIIQYFLSYRAFNINDLIANIFGILLGLVLILPGISNSLITLFRSKQP